MELWIRSQDKRALKQIDRIYLTDTPIIRTDRDGNNTKKIYTIYDCEYMGDLGYYSTEKQALEVLDEIQKLLTPKIIINNDFFNENMSLSEMTHITAKYMQHCRENILVDQIHQVVYQMPEDKGADYDTI